MFGYVMKAVAAFKRQADRVPVELLQKDTKTKRPWMPPRQYLEVALDFLLEDAQRNISMDCTLGLGTEEIIKENGLFPPCRLRVVAGRAKKFLRVAYDAEFVPLLPNSHPLSRLYLEEAHKTDHGGTDAMVMGIRAQVWVVGTRKLAKWEKRNCFTCRKIPKEREMQKMAPLPSHRMGPATVFESSAVDMFGPITFQDTVNKHGNGKAWDVIFVYTATSLVDVEVTDAYSTGSFLLAVRRYKAMHGAPR